MDYSKQRSRINRAMRLAGNTEYRQEQGNLEKILYALFFDYGIKSNFTITQEYVVRFLEEYQGIKPYPQLPPRLDNAVSICYMFEDTPHVIKIGFRLMGAVHEVKRRRIRDENQRVLLMGNRWHIEDFWYDKHAALWNSHLTNEDYYTAKNLVDSKLRPILEPYMRFIKK